MLRKDFGIIHILANSRTIIRRFVYQEIRELISARKTSHKHKKGPDSPVAINSLIG